MNILITISDSYVPYAGVMLQSLADSNPELTFDVYIICPDISQTSKKMLDEQFKNEKSEAIRLEFPDIPQNINDEINRMAPYLVKSLNTSFILRLYSPRIIPEHIHQILYMDVDTLVISPLSELATMQLNQTTALAAVKDLVRGDDYQRLGINESNHIYFNSGIMLLNLDYWRKNMVGEKCLELLRKNSTLYMMPDQDALNVVCQGHVEYLHPKFNCLIFFFAKREFLDARIRKEERENIREATECPAIIHYVFVNKPWHKDSFLPKKDLWMATLHKTVWKNIPIKYKNGLKGWVRNTFKIVKYNILPFFGFQSNDNIFSRCRYAHITYFFLLLYYGFAYWLPNFDSRFFGKICNSIRIACVRNIFEYVGKDVHIGRKARFGNGKNIRIDNRSNIGANCRIPANTIIGKNVMMGPNNFFFAGFTHDIADPNKPMIEQGFRFIKGQTEIADDVWIGRDCLFMPCLTIGAHSVVGARSVVTKNVPEYVITAGNPAKIIKHRK